MDQTIATAVNKEPFSFKTMLLKCFPFTERGDRSDSKESPISAVRLQLSVNDLKGCRKLTLKGLYGDQELLKTFIANFRTRTINLVNSQQQKQQSRPTPRGSTNSRRPAIQQQEDSDEESDLRVGKYTETSSVY